jgi:hypothetical protein
MKTALFLWTDWDQRDQFAINSNGAMMSYPSIFHYG